MLCHETKSSRVRVTYLASGWNVCWAVRWLPGALLDSKGGTRGLAFDAGFERGVTGVSPFLLDLNEGSQAVLGALDLKEKNKQA